MVTLDATVDRDGSESQSHVTDLSLDGCCLSGNFRIGEQVTVRIARLGQFPAQVRWALPGRAGVRFARTEPKTERKLSADARGVAAIEYALIASLISVAIIMGVAGTGRAVGNNWNEVNQAIPNGVPVDPA